MTKNEIPEGVYFCRKKKGEDGDGEVRCFSVKQIDKMFDIQKCPIEGD